MNAHSLHGHWLIESMAEWDDDFIYAGMHGYFEFGDDKIGSFHFGYVYGHIDYCLTERERHESAEFSWQGNDEMEPVSGRGWATLKDGKLEGRLSFCHVAKS